MFIFFIFQASGVTVSDACKTTYEEIKKDKKHRYVVFFIRDEKQIDVEAIGERGAEYDAFLEDLQVSTLDLVFLRPLIGL